MCVKKGLRTIVTSRDELASALVERAVRERKNVSSKNLVKIEISLYVRFLPLYQFIDQSAKLRFPLLTQQRLFLDDLIRQHFHVRIFAQVQKIDLLLSRRAVSLRVFQNNTWCIDCEDY